MVVPSTMFTVYDPPNSETRVSKCISEFPSKNTIVHVQFSTRKLAFKIIPKHVKYKSNYPIKVQYIKYMQLLI